jgi:hypothetical protein
MDKPDFSSVLKKAHVRRIGPEQPTVRAIPPGQLIYGCYCCQDTGIVQTWKLERFTNSFGFNLDPTMSIPVFCRRKITCGTTTLQIFSGYKSEEDEQTRTVDSNLFTRPDGTNTAIGDMIGRGALPHLTREQSEYIHQMVINMHKEGEANPEAPNPISRQEISEAVRGLR